MKFVKIPNFKIKSKIFCQKAYLKANKNAP